MGLFDKLFDKKECAICGGEIGLLGNKKLEDGNMCKACASRLSPWFDDRRHSTVEQIKQQLAYREENRQRLMQFRPTQTFGEMYELKVEVNNGIPLQFVIARTDDYREENADLISFRQVTSFDIDIDESETELKRRNSQGEMVSYVPARYQYSYDFYVEIHTDCPYYDDIRFRLNRSTLDLETVKTGRSKFGPKNLNPTRFKNNFKGDFDPTLYPEYREYEAMCEAIEEIFRAGMQGMAMGGYVQQPTGMNAGAYMQQPVNMYAAPPVVEQEMPAAVEKRPKFCSNCGAPAEGGKFCQSCGSPLGIE